MANIFVVGMQWGDEGKGKVVDVFAPHVSAVIRSNGGENAGHTLKTEHGETVFHIVPAGIFTDALCIIEKGVAMSPEGVLREMKYLTERGASLKNLKISPLAHLVMPWHPVEDGLREERMKTSGGQIGTTGKGIGPCYQEKAGRTDAFRVGDLRNMAAFLEKLERVYKEKIKRLRIEGAEIGRAPSILLPELPELRERFKEMRGYILPFVTDTFKIIRNLLDEEKDTLIEIAHGTLLDPDWGTYPYVTSSNTTSGAASHVCGVPLLGARVVGVAKAYPTRVGGGPFPTELDPALSETLRNLGKEFGATTGRPRRCGLPDLPLLRYARRINGVTEVALTKTDVLGQIESFRVCTRYRRSGEDIGVEDVYHLAEQEPEYTHEFEGWGSLNGVRYREDLPEQAKKFIALHETFLKRKVTLISSGGTRKEVISF